MGPRGPTERQKATNQISYRFGYPIFFTREFKWSHYSFRCGGFYISSSICINTVLMAFCVTFVWTFLRGALAFLFLFWKSSEFTSCNSFSSDPISFSIFPPAARQTATPRRSVWPRSALYCHAIGAEGTRFRNEVVCKQPQCAVSTCWSFEPRAYDGICFGELDFHVPGFSPTGALRDSAPLPNPINKLERRGESIRRLYFQSDKYEIGSKLASYKLNSFRKV